MGCQMNEYDSDYLAQVLVNSNFLPTDTPNSADLILINTCSVRAKAEQKALSLLGRMISLKRRKPDLIVGIAGCIAQQEGSKLMERFPELDLVLGTREIGSIEDLLEKLVSNRQKIVATDIDLKPPSPMAKDGYFRGRVKSYVSIMEGCDNFCSYCIVPYVRGREVSRPPDDILRETEHLISQGVKEVTLLGQNVNSYVWGKGEAFRFPSLLRELSKRPGLARIRFTTSHPKDLSEDLMRCFGELENLCPHIHLPLQAGSNKILELMNRGYTREKYLELVKNLRMIRRDIAISSDVMVGFPKESHEDFGLTLDLIREIEFDSLYSFKYSDRKGTLAERMDGKISEAEKSSRLAQLQQIQKSITLKKNRRLEGQALEILVEGESKKGGQLTGRTATNKIVNFANNNSFLGKLVNVTIKRAHVNSLWGVLTVISSS
jgi:tRNA-2-methylthio-N6-dimethylallyladenosine synthase